MTELLTAAQMRAIEHAAIDCGEVTGLELMERAGRGVVEAIFEEWSELAKSSYRAVVLCGPGNNGGDGFVVARLLKEWGWEVRALLLGSPENLPSDAQKNYDRWLRLGEVEPLTEKNLRRLPASLYVDAIFGTGLSRPLGGQALAVISHMAGRNGDDFSQAIASIDAPSGLCLDSGQVLGRVGGSFDGELNRFARLTVTFDSPKLGHFLALGSGLCGTLVVKSIGLKHCRERFARIEKRQFTRRPGAALLTKRPIVADNRLELDFSRRLCMLDKTGWRAHKFNHGHGLILSGPSGQTGAARLAARGALRIGAGLVTIGCPLDAVAEQAAQLTAIMLTPIDSAATFEEYLADPRITSLCLGPGMGRNDLTKAMVKVALKSGRKIVLDADALSVFESDPETLFDLAHHDVVLTPHGGEFARLFPDLAQKLRAEPMSGPAYSKVDATCEAAARAGCVVFYKGADTVIAHPDGRCSVNSAQYERAAPWLATAGSGDVLAGFIAGLLARGFAPMQAAEVAAWLHVECALSFGPGLIAEDLPEELPKVLRHLTVT